MILGVIALIIMAVIKGVINKQERKTFETSIRGIMRTIDIDLSDEKYVQSKTIKMEVIPVSSNTVSSFTYTINGTGASTTACNNTICYGHDSHTFRVVQLP